MYFLILPWLPTYFYRFGGIHWQKSIVTFIIIFWIVYNYLKMRIIVFSWHGMSWYWFKLKIDQIHIINSRSRIGYSLTIFSLSIHTYLCAFKEKRKSLKDDTAYQQLTLILCAQRQSTDWYCWILGGWYFFCFTLFCIFIFGECYLNLTQLLIFTNPDVNV